ncbi:MAG: hypothetical protein IJ532_01820 [Alphaproteobacteria bacterium]|nr:hypothetical protein [Alphaproteobacteria bacterium]
MSDFSASFLEYLKIYNPSDYDKVNSGKLKPEELTGIYNANISKYEIWESIPETIRNRYLGQQIPQDVWEAAQRGEVYTLQEMERHPEIKRVEEAREKVAEKYSMPADIVSDAATGAFITAVVAGYAMETCHQLALHRQQREDMLKNKPENMTDEEKEAWMKQWLEVRQKDFNLIKKDWTEHQPEKLLMHLLAKYNRGRLNADETEKFPQMIDDLMRKIESPDNNRMQNLLDYIKTPRMQARIGRFNDETLNILTHTVLRKVPEAEKEQYLAKDFSKRREELRNMPDSAKAQSVSDNINQMATRLPEERTLSTIERLANMPSALNKGRTI